MFSLLNYAGYMEDKNMVDCIVLRHIYFCGDHIFHICPLQIHTRWLPPVGLIFCTCVNDGNMALCTPKEIYV